MTTEPANIAARLEQLLGSVRIAADAASCANYAVDEIIPSAIAKPSSAEEVAEVVRFAALEKLALIPCGARTKLGIGMPPSRYDIALEMTGLNQIAHYDPGDLTLSVDAGASFNDFAVPLYNQKQFLPLSVPFYFESTIGGIIASGVDSGLRQSYGTARDFLIGAEFVDGTGRLCKSGGRVVKNVTGYDLHKLLIGSLGTLAVITRLNFRTFPAAPASRGFVASFRAAEDALLLRRLIADSPLAPASIELLSPELMQHLLRAAKSAEEPTKSLEGKFPADSWHLCVSVEGTGEVCDRSARDLVRLAGHSAAKNIQAIVLNENDGADLWHYIGQAVPVLLEASSAAAIFRIAQLPGRLGPLLTQLSAVAEHASLAHAVMARGCGVVYFTLLPHASDATGIQGPADEANTLSHFTTAASAVFQLCDHESASATLPWCPVELKRALGPRASLRLFASGRDPVATPFGRPDLVLMRRLKSAFDPHNVFAPGRL